ncbi:hypothetical protein NFI96_001975 [Prochilodus magdalenae]|nr:hypothetical protein NFI96_001975 [Prochilodus magdalenae]
MCSLLLPRYSNKARAAHLEKAVGEKEKNPIKYNITLPGDSIVRDGASFRIHIHIQSLLGAFSLLGGNEEVSVSYCCLTDVAWLQGEDVIHTVGPIARGNVGPSQSDDLRSCYENSLKLMKDNKLRSVAVLHHVYCYKEYLMLALETSSDSWFTDMRLKTIN